MNNPLNTSNGQGLLKNFYAAKKKQKGPIAQMNQSLPMIEALRKRRDMIGKTQTMSNLK